MWSFPGTYGNRESETEQASSDVVESGGLARLRAGRVAALTCHRHVIHSRSLRVRLGHDQTQKTAPKGGLLCLVESGGLEPSTFRV